MANCNTSTKRLRLIIFAILLNSFASCDPAALYTPHNPDGKCSCTSELSLCKLEADKLSFAVGETGPVGEKGPKGEKGKPGPNGNPGKEGAAGYNGTNGIDGAQGPKGPNGETGPPGPPGEKGEKGDKGLQSTEPGPQGEQGAPGDSGTCSCSNEYYEQFPPKVVKDWGTKDNPGKVTCRNAPIDKTGTYYLYNGIEVECDHKTHKTCVKTTSKNKTVSYTESKPFWLRQKSLTFEDIYGLDADKLAWLQRESYTSSMTIRYHCKNSVPNTMTLLTSTDVKVGPEPTPLSPFHYNIDNDNDFCTTAEKDEWKYTDIQLVSVIAQRLPIIDFLINDVGKENQAVRIEITRLCFG